MRTKVYTWLGVSDIQAPSHQGFETNKKILTLIKVWRSESLTARTWLIVATRLQVWHSSFQLCSSSNTPSVLVNVAYGPFANPMRKCTIHLATLVLRGAWANRHHSRPGCNLDELNNQSEPTHGLASHLRNNASWESLLELWRVSLGTT
jgi:hypothetical protein